MMTILCVYLGLGSRRRTGRGFYFQYGPVMMTVLATLLILADPLRHVLQDAGIWPAPGSSEYRSDCDSESIRCLSVVGWLITIGCTYGGFILLTVATFWNANIIVKLKKIKAKWNQLRQKRKEQQEKVKVKKQEEEEEENLKQKMVNGYDMSVNNNTVDINTKVDVDDKIDHNADAYAYQYLSAPL